MREQTEVWLEYAKRDLSAAEALYAHRRYAYVLFACQQAIEKTIKAVLVEQTGGLPRKIHDLVTLCREAGIALSPEQAELLGELTYLYIETRYPGMNTDAAFAMDTEDAEHYWSQTKEVCAWLREMIR